jgi:hypothetical protein
LCRFADLLFLRPDQAEDWFDFCHHERDRYPILRLAAARSVRYGNPISL